MAQQTLKTFATLLTAAATNVATQMGSGTTAANVQAIGQLLQNMALHPDHAIPLMSLTPDTNIAP